MNEYDANGLFVRNVVPPGFGTPFGLAVDSNGTLYLADIGIVLDPTGIPDNPQRLGFDTGPGEGSVQRVRFVAGVPLPPEVLQDTLEFPDGLGIIAPPSLAGLSSLPEPGSVAGVVCGAMLLGALRRRLRERGRR